MSTQSKTWKSTGYRNIYRHKSGTYYVRISSGGKPSWKSLRTKSKEIAFARADDFRREHLAGSERQSDTNLNAKTTMAELVALRLEQIENDPALKPRTVAYWGEIYDSLAKSWAGFNESKAKSVKPINCQRWAKKYAGMYSPTRFNNALGGLRKLFAITINEGIRFTDPSRDIKRLRPNQKDLSAKLPNKEQFGAWVEEIRNGHGRFSQACANFVEFLAYTGLRVGEAKHVLWQHCDIDAGEILVTGDPVHGTKNHQIRRVPMIDPLVELLQRMMRALGNPDPQQPVCLVNEAQKAMDRAGAKLGLERITHHDLRHLFATTCIESGVDVPTVSKWLGHKDGGALAMKTYGHLRNEHSKQAAKKVQF